MKHMRRCGRVVLACSALAMLAACSGQAHIGFSAYTDRPVVLTDMSINGKPVPLVPPEQVLPQWQKFLGTVTR